MKELSGLNNQLAKFQEEFRKLGKHIEQAQGSFETAQKHLDKFSDKLISMEAPALPSISAASEKDS
jgi:DNA anti-recombination protein RmuC